MYSRALRSVISFSTTLKHQKTFKYASILPTMTLLVQKISNKNCHYQLRYFSSDEDDEFPEMVKDPHLRKIMREQEAELKLNELKEQDPNLEKLIKVIDLELCVLRQEGERVPSKLKNTDWLEILKLKSRSQRRKYFNHLFIKEKRREREEQDKINRYLKLEEVREERLKLSIKNEEKIIYGIYYNSMFRRITEPTMKRLWHWNCLTATMYGNKLIFDCGYEQYMSSFEKQSCARQLLAAYAYNRVHDYAMDIYLCNANPRGELFTKLHKYIPTLYEDWFPITVTSKSYLELFDKSQLVYLSPNAQQEMEKYDPNSIYIIGAFVDKSCQKPVSLGKAKKEGLKMQKLPLDRYIKLGDGSGKNLAINQVCSIIMDTQRYDWKTALKHVPTRKHEQTRKYVLEQRIQYDIQRSKRQKLDILGNPNEEYEFQNESQEPSFLSESAVDFGHSARAKLRKQWNK